MANKTRRRSCLTAWIAVCLAVSSNFASAAGFFQSIDDLPLAPGLTEAVDQGVRFDSPGGRIVTAVAQGDGGTAAIAAVRAFYRKALPPLGWAPVSANSYTREGERLDLHFETAEKRVIVRIRLVPAGSN